MAKVKKELEQDTNVHSDSEQKAEKKKVGGPANANGVQKATKKKGGAKSKKAKHPMVSEMVASAFTTLKNRKGHSLQAIRSFITTQYDCTMTKRIQILIRKYIAKEFEEGRVKMVNDDGENINYTKRFALIK